VAKRDGRKSVLDGVSLDVERGQIVAIVGENGCGKSTRLKICAGVLPPDAGQVRTFGRVGYCPQEPGLFELLDPDQHLVAFGAGAGLGRRAALGRGRRLLADLGFPPGESTVARHLSGGSRQKLNLALALIGDPAVLLLDEPYQGFDRGTYVNLWDQLHHWRDRGTAILLVTHLLTEVGRVDRVLDLSTRATSGPVRA
jgi:ABC-type multidrug transport system ATPase subunit